MTAMNDTPGCRQIREMIQAGCYRIVKPISRAEFERRVAIEHAHDCAARRGNKLEVLNEKRAELGGRCPRCGETVDETSAICGFVICRECGENVRIPVDGS